MRPLPHTRQQKEKNALEPATLLENNFFVFDDNKGAM